MEFLSTYGLHDLSNPYFVEVTRRNLPEYVDLIRTSLKNSLFVGLALHSTVPPNSVEWIPGESLQEHYVRLTKLALKHELYGIGISCASATEDPVEVAIRNFNLTIATAATSLTSPQSMRQMRQLGYDLNYVAGEAALYYRGGDDALHQSEESKFLREIFLDLHGDGSHPVVFQHGFLDLILAYTAFTGLPGDKVEEFLQQVYDLFPGKILDPTVLAANQPINRSEKALSHCFFPVDGVTSADIFSFSDSVDVRHPRPNVSHPAVLDSFCTLKSFLQSLEGDFTSVKSKVEDFGNRLLPVSAPHPVQIQPQTDSRLRPTKKRKTEFDFTIPLTAIVSEITPVEQEIPTS